MECKLMSLPVVQLARCLFLVKRISPVRLSDSRSQWALLIEGRGFTRLLRDDPLSGPMLYRPSGWSLPAPRTFHSQSLAVRCAQELALMPKKTKWTVGGNPGAP